MTHFFFSGKSVWVSGNKVVLGSKGRVEERRALFIGEEVDEWMGVRRYRVI